MRETADGLVLVRPGLWINWHAIESLKYAPEEHYEYPEPHVQAALWRCHLVQGHIDLLTVEEGSALEDFLVDKIAELTAHI
jgi:hypothetical protein